MKVSELRTKNRLKVFKVIKKKYLLLILCVIFIVLFVNIDFDKNGMYIYFVDVGQGDCIVVKDHQYTFMIDGGGDRFMDESNNIGTRVVYPFLLDQGIHKIDCVFITHVHFDHIKGVLEILELVDVETVVLPDVYRDYYENHDKVLDANSSATVQSENQIYDEDFVNSIFQGGDELFLYDELIEICHKNDIRLLFMEEGQVVSGENSNFTCIYPEVGRTYSEHENENSLVLLLELGGVETLLTGDIEENGEKWIVSHKPELKNIDILKVSHHGSNSSSTEEFLLKTNPKVAIVSVGENLFGHPSDIVMMRYKNLNIPFYSTKKYGMIEVLIKEDYYKIEPYKGELINESITRTIKD